MPVPRIEGYDYVPSEVERKICKIEDFLNEMGYYCDGSESVVNIIEKYGLDKTQFDFPYGSFDEFKRHALAADFNEDFKSHHLSRKETRKLLDDIEKGKIWVTY